jgi:secondary thiamine-phosphate synthase enzyme
LNTTGEERTRSSPVTFFQAAVPQGWGLSMVITTTHTLRTRGQGDAHDVTSLVADAIARSSLADGLATISVTGSTAGVTTIEFEPGAVADLGALFEEIAPRRADYRHHLRWGDDNGSSHVRAALLGPSLSIPFAKGELLLGTWQQITLFEFDTRPRQREIVVQLIG